MGLVIVLNGPSGAGKTTAQKHIQALATEPYVRLGVDNLFDTVLPDAINLGRAPAHFNESDVRSITVTQRDGFACVPMHVGPIGRRAIAGMHQAIAAYARVGNNVVVDYILYDATWLHELAAALDGVRAYFVGFNIGLDELERREALRGTSPVGHARSHYDTVHGPGLYDLSLDVSTLSPTDIAATILDYVRITPQPHAFATLRQQAAPTPGITAENLTFRSRG